MDTYKSIKSVFGDIVAVRKDNVGFIHITTTTRNDEHTSINYPADAEALAIAILELTGSNRLKPLDGKEN